MNVLDLFSGVGGFSLGLEWAGFRTVAFCEIDKYCRRILAKHWPDVPCYPDVRELSAAQLADDGVGPIDVICGGFPCQDISAAGRGVGIAGERSGLWREFFRLICEIRPRLVIVENVAAMLGRGMGEVLGDLASIGYDTEWHCIPASYVGAPHRRDRVWIVAHAADAERVPLWNLEQRTESGRHYVQPRGQAVARNDGEARHLADSNSGRCEVIGFEEHGAEQRASRREPDGCGARGSRHGPTDPNAERERLEGFVEGGTASQAIDRSRDECDSEWWAAEPDVGRVADGVPARVDRLRALGNAVVPQIPEMIGRALKRIK